MIIESLELSNFRNYENLQVEFAPGINIFYGDNAQGKTNILEAVYLSCTTKSHKSSKDREMIRFGEEEAHLKLMVEKREVPFRIDMHLKKSKNKGIAVNQLPIKKASELFGIVNVIFFSPEDLQIIKNGPAERRKFIDMELSQLDKIYLHNLISYNKVLMQRNSLLKDLYFHPEYESTLDVWDMQMAEYGRKVMALRRQFVERLNQIVEKIHSNLTGGGEQILLVYEPNTEENLLEQEIALARERDKKLKTTTVGPHRDDICFSVNGIDIRKFGSQGQQRTAALSLKLAEIELVKELVKDTPILLLDDVLSELDSNRQNQLLDSIHGIQTMITCTGLDDFVNHRFSMNSVFHVVNGNVTKEN